MPKKAGRSTRPSRLSANFETSAIEDLRAQNEQLRESQSVLEQSRDEYVVLFESSPVASLVVDERGAIRMVNQAAIDLLGQPGDRLAGRPVSQIVCAEDRAIVRAHIDRCARQPSPDTCEVRLEGAHGAKRLVRFCTRRPADGRPLLDTAILDLEERERERAEKKLLIEVAESARKTGEAKDRFIAMLSHELRTPLTPILMGASALQGDVHLPEKARNTLAAIVRNVRLEARLVDDLLDVTRIAQGKMQLQRTPTDLHKVVRAVCEAFGPDMLEKNQTAWLALEADHRVAHVDPARMHQLFSNLFKNAVKFTPVGGTIKIRSWNGPSTISIEVEDNGVGMDPGELSHIFDPFSQPGRDPVRSREGLGLGLTISKAITDLHGGKIDAVSRGRGLGSRFVVQLQTMPAPAVSEEPAHAAPALDVSARASSTLPERETCRILFVEDDIETADMIAEMLVSEGYDVSRAGSVREALDVDVANVDVIVSDLGLPDGDGRDLIRTLQKSGHHPAIALSGFGMESDVDASMEAGFDVHLTKPVDFDKLVSTIRTVAHQRN